ncbi:rhodanese-like domain-containing protein [Roseateles sp.]|uniref:rhodanese-like domain-containing protein n=1 Tax=Roseateles sp. TaxID=1971397 RepID=UPI00286B769E|nr:rhodanese-like domain-containing protein [Roseateles sp.]
MTLAMTPAMALALAGSFGSVARWREDFVALPARSKAGRVLLSLQPRTGLLVNQAAADQGVVLLALELAEQQDPVAAAQAFIAQIDWDEVYALYQAAVQDASEGFAADLAQLDLGRQVVVDVRRDAMFEQAQTMLPGAHWRDPAQVADWATELQPGAEVLVYCVYGHEVGRVTAVKLRALGIKASYLPGGIDAWAAAGKPLQNKQDLEQ